MSEWVGHDAPVVFAGAELAGVYLGPADAPEVIDPSLPLVLGSPDWDAATVTRPPHYGELTPAARAAYLVWQRTGRRIPQAPAVWALLHLYGLERRILVDGDTDPELRREAKQLGEVYGHDDEVARVAKALAGEHPHTDPPPLDDGPAPDALQIELGRKALVPETISAEWALAWAWYHPELPRRDAARKTPEEFARLWSHRFDQRYPEGLALRPKRRRLALDYTPANPGLPTPLELSVPDASDVFLTAAPAEALAEISDQVEAELAPYVRWRTRYPDDADTDSIRAAAVLPEPLFTGSDAEAAAQPLADAARAALAEDATAITECSPLLRLWADATNQASVDRRDAVEIAQVLERFGIGIEPDVRFGGRPISRRSPAVLFRQTGTPATSPSEAYAAALVALELCAAVASADGVVDDAEQAMLVEQVSRFEELTDAERARLDAHRVMVASSELRLDDVASRMVGLPLAERHSLASYLLDLARVDGVVTDDEVRVLRAIHEILEIDPAGVDRRLRPRVVPLAPRQPVDAPAEPVTVPPVDEEPGDDEPAVPDDEAPTAVVATAPPEPTDPPVRLVQVDEERLSTRQADNERVRSLLTAIFDDEDDDEVEEPAAPEPSGAVIGTLDAAHTALLRDLAERRRSSRQELEKAAAKLGVLPDGALDVINEAALDLAEDLVVETHDDESVTVDPDVYEEMCA